MSLSYAATRRASYVGYITQGIVNNLAPVLFIIFRTRYNLSYERLGFLILLNFTTQLVVDVLAIRLVDRIGYRRPIVMAHVCSALGLVLLAVLPGLFPAAYTGLVIATVVSAVGGGLLEVLVSPIVDSLPAPEHQKAAGMSLLHSFYCWGQVAVVLITTLALKIIGDANWHILPLIWALIPFCNIFAFIKAPLIPTLPEEKRASLRSLFQTPAFMAILLLMLCAGASELTISQWASIFAEQGLGLSKVWGDLAGPCMFALFMGLGRTFYGIWGAKIRLAPFMAGSAGLCVLCYLAASLSGSPVFSLIGCAVCGLSVCIMWPGTFSVAARRFPLGGTAMFGIMAMCGDMGCSLGPWIAGLIADRADGGLKTGILFGTIFPLIMLAALFLLYRRKKENSPA